MATAEGVLAVARGELGNTEDGNGCQKYGVYYGMNCVAWCAEFQWWVFNHAGAGGLLPKTAYTPTLYNWFAQRGKAGKAPRPGALVFYDWPDNEHRIQHVGIVEAVLANGAIQTIEGNTGNTPCSVKRQVRSTTYVVGYGYPDYDNAPAAPPPPPAPSAGSGLPTLAYGMRNNASVANFQRWSNAYPWSPALPLLPPTGNYLDQTKEVVRRAQVRMGVTGPDADGSIIGPRTNAGLWQRGYRG